MHTDVIPGLKALWKTVFGDPDSFIDTFFQTAYAPDRCRFTEENGRILSALYWFDCSYEGGRLAYIYAVATHPEHRGKGLASRLLADTHRHLKALGYAGCVLKPAGGLFPFYERLGYATCGHIRRFCAASGTVPTAVKEVTAAEYGCLRRDYLPAGGIIQEDLTLDFLHTFASFYASENAVFVLSHQDPVIFEFLGNTDSVPGILAALSISRAEISTIGNEIPFAMWHPLNCTKMPGYLGISLE